MTMADISSKTLPKHGHVGEPCSLCTVPPTLVSGAAAQEALNAHLSFLDFYYRILHEAIDARNPLLERVRYLAIFGDLIDQFFMLWYNPIKCLAQANPDFRLPDGLTYRRQFESVRDRLSNLVHHQGLIWHQELRPALEQRGIVFKQYDALTQAQRKVAADYFHNVIGHVLTPLAVGPGHPFPLISNLSLSIGILLRPPGHFRTQFARVKVPEQFPRWLTIPDGDTRVLVALESLICGQLSAMFPGMEILETSTFRVTRSAEMLAGLSGSEDTLGLVQERIRARRFDGMVRIQIAENMSEEMQRFIMAGLGAGAGDLTGQPEPLALSDLKLLTELDLPALKWPPCKSVRPAALADGEGGIFSVLRTRDILVNHPYESFADSVENFILSAAQDPQVLAIKMTLYRTSADSPFVAALVRAVEAGKQVAVLVELKADFDESANIQWAQTIENAGAHVVYGHPELETHVKMALVVRQEGAAVRPYAHISTGNYNSRTARIYCDLGFFTCRQDICQDVENLFNYLTGASLKSHYHKLLVAPVTMRSGFLTLINRETDHVGSGGFGRIVAQMNALDDPEIIAALYRASEAGVKIDLFVRGLCCLRPQVPGLSANIRVTSIIGQFLEHARAFWFANNGHDEFYIGSSDWVTQKLDHRVEVVVLIEDPILQDKLRDRFTVMLEDNRQAWDLGADGIWRQRRPAAGEAERGSQWRLRTLAGALPLGIMLLGMAALTFCQAA
ncbi:MAG: polyphosphate kinase 1 [Phycisphaerae bacterium]